MAAPPVATLATELGFSESDEEHYADESFSDDSTTYEVSAAPPAPAAAASTREATAYLAVKQLAQHGSRVRQRQARVRRFYKQSGAVADLHLGEWLALVDRRKQLQTAEIAALEAAELKLTIAELHAELNDARGRLQLAEASALRERGRRVRAETQLEEEYSRRHEADAGGTAEGGAAATAAEAPADHDKPALAVAAATEHACREVIERIRAEKMVGVAMPDDPVLGVAVEQLQATLGRALQKLGNDLYANSQHFVHEMVQNADDNHYMPGIEPCLSIEVTTGGLAVRNNEVGFTAEDVAAICNLGASTKEGDLTSIGHKGMGFKSVFAVSDCPVIFSGGFRFKFDIARYGLLGYITPEWCDTHAELAGPDGGAATSGTAMHLPFRAGGNGVTGRPDVAGGVDAGAAVNKQLLPATLLFLRQLRSIKVKILTGRAAACGLRELRRATAPSQTVGLAAEEVEEIWDGGAEIVTHRYQTWREAIMVPAHLAEGAGGRQSTQLALAFPEDPATAGQQWVHTFLPVLAAGFSFSVQAELLLVSSRQQVHQDSGWNIWLRGQLPGAFANALNASESLRENLGASLGTLCEHASLSVLYGLVC